MQGSSVKAACIESQLSTGQNLCAPRQHLSENRHLEKPVGQSAQVPRFPVSSHQYVL